MDVKSLRDQFLADIIKQYDIEEARSFFYILTNKILKLSRATVAIHLDRILTAKELFHFDQAKIKLLAQEPIQYIVDETEFYGSLFYVDSNVLIPRPETEELVDWIIKDHLGVKEKLRVLDIGTGSGCIAISLAKNLPGADVYALDISAEALKITQKNADNNNAKITCLQQDILQLNTLSMDFDIIVSNPPYVRVLEKQEMKANVLENEPSLALFVSDDDPLVFYERITALAIKNLKRSGNLYFEINQYLGEEMMQMIKNKGFDQVILRKDIFGNDRMIKVEKSK
ncbi:peptide chain release factor N(5)-glutamine methyltransferase [Aquimarina algicola]|uniref:Release factor glutamine methyltransferase n=1 Tax=Aquimarina algicola TaxID=2589995 RepID=A0A504J263_9FLAO|nr:peptide chain release factor N(5)-glutamine methyltransferase [Aquimarina algicola]TPN82098.1 peptide chain release factor N(5)-glutamine methyltransferase [Aquimarina algicola]